MNISIRQGRHGIFQRLRLTWRKYLAILQVSIANNLAYIYEVFFRAMTLLVIVFVLSQLWHTTLAQHGAKVLSGFSINDMLWYLVAAEVIAMSNPALSQRIDEEVRSGQIAYQLIRPNSYVLYHFSRYLGERLVRIVMNGIVGAALALVVVGPPHFTWLGIAVWPLLTFFALCIDFVAYFCIGLCAFWTEETRPIALIYNRLTLVLGGVLAPIEIFPQPLRSIAQALPFSAILYGPAHTLVHFTWSGFFSVLSQQCSMIAIGSLLLLGMYQIVIRRVNINGG